MIIYVIAQAIYNFTNKNRASLKILALKTVRINLGIHERESKSTKHP